MHTISDARTLTPVETAGLAFLMVGAGVSVLAAVWLLLGFKPSNPRYTDDGPLSPGRQVSQVVPNLLRAQAKVAALVVLGTTLQFVGAVLAFLAT